MSSPINPDENPDELKQIIELIKRHTAGTVLDQFTALREDVTETTNLALKLAAQAEVLANSSRDQLKTELNNLQDTLNGLTPLIKKTTRDLSVSFIMLHQFMALSSTAHIAQTVFTMRRDLENNLKFSAEYIDSVNQLQLLMIKSGDELEPEKAVQEVVNIVQLYIGKAMSACSALLSN